MRVNMSRRRFFIKDVFYGQNEITNAKSIKYITGSLLTEEDDRKYSWLLYDRKHCFSFVGFKNNIMKWNVVGRLFRNFN